MRAFLPALLVAALPLLAQTGEATWAASVPKTFQEPAWWDQGVVFVGNWEPLVFRLRAGGVTTDVVERYRREHTEETVLRLKRAGVNMILTHFYKTGLDSDREDIEQARQLGELCHKHGLKLGAYVGGTIFAETLLRDVPEAAAWVRRDEYGNALRYGNQPHRYLPDFNHPGYVEHMKKVARLAVEYIRADLIHFDNHALRAPPDTGNTPEINRRFRAFLTAKYTPAQLKNRLGFADIRAVTVPTWHGFSRPAIHSPIEDPLIQEWIDFRCQDFAAYYGKLAGYIRQLNPNVLVELNPHGIFGANRAFWSGVDHARLLPHGSVFWSEEGNEAHVNAEGVLVSKIRSLKLARSLDQTLFIYTGAEYTHAPSHRLLMAESMAFNRNCLGDIGGPLSEFPDDVRRYIRFYLDQNRVFAGTRVAADVAVVRSFPSLAYNSRGPHLETTLMEQLLIQHQIPFEYVFDGNLGDLARYRAVVLAGQESLSDRAIDQIRAYVRAGGGLVATGHTSLYNDWRRRRPDYALADVLGVRAAADGALPPARQGTFGRGRVAYVPSVVPSRPVPDAQTLGTGGYRNSCWHLPRNSGELAAGLRYAAGGFSVEFAPAHLSTVMELTDKKDGSARLLHWLNYGVGTGVKPAAVALAVPGDRRVTGIEILSPDRAAAPVRFEQSGGRVRFTMPGLEVYNIAVVRLGR